MKVLAYSDLHFFEDYTYGDRLRYTIQTCKWIAEQIAKHKPDLVVNCGDTNHTHGYIDVTTLSALMHGLGTISAACNALGAPHVLIAGNHDRATEEDTVLSAFMGDPRVMLVEHEVQYVTRDKVAMAFVPYGTPWPEDKLDLVFAHREFKGALYRAGVETEGGVKPNQVRSLVISGHYHIPQVLTTKKGKVVFLGSGVAHNFADPVVSQARGCLIVNSKNWNVKRLENPHGPRFMTVTPSSEAELKLLKKTLRGIKGTARAKRLHLRIRPKGSYSPSEKMLRLLRRSVAQIYLQSASLDLPDVEVDHATPVGFHDMLADLVTGAELPSKERTVLRAGRRILDAAAKS